MKHDKQTNKQANDEGQFLITHVADRPWLIYVVSKGTKHSRS